MGIVRKINLDWAEEVQNRVRGNQFGEYEVVEVETRMARWQWKRTKGLGNKRECEGRIHRRLGVQWWNRGNIYTRYLVNSQKIVQKKTR